MFIKPVLDILGFSNIPQVVTRGKGRAERPDYALFANENERDIAYSFQNNETAFYGRVLVIAEAKYWERPLSKVSANDKRDIFKNENPSFQISSYLTGTGVDWGILTNGRYIVSHTLKPILEERKQKFADLMMQISQLHEKMADGRLGVQSRNGLQKDLQRLERKSTNTLLDIKICDPAMGSGHFLVEAV